MNVVGLTADEQNNIFRMLAAILWLGNAQFAESDDGSGSQITDTGVTVSSSEIIGSIWPFPCRINKETRWLIHLQNRIL